MPIHFNHLSRRWASILLVLAIGIGLALWLMNDLNILRHLKPIESELEAWIANNEQRYTLWVLASDLTHTPWLLIPVAFLGGLIASLAPCILALVPVNMTYIGTLNPTSRQQALQSALGFVLGVVVVLSLFGLVSSFAGILTVAYKGYAFLLVGLISLLMGLGIFGVFTINLPTRAVKLTMGTAPFLVGMTFATVTSPCASPVLASMLLAAGSTGNSLLSVATMMSYALGYTFIVLIASLFTGIARQIQLLRPYATTITKIGGLLLAGIGVYYMFLGWQWFVS